MIFFMLDTCKKKKKDSFMELLIVLQQHDTFMYPDKYMGQFAFVFSYCVWDIQMWMLKLKSFWF